MKNSKASKIFVLAISVLLLAGCFIGVSASAEDSAAPEVEILFNNLQYGDNISILYAAKVNGAEGADIRMDFYTKVDGVYSLAYSDTTYKTENITVKGVTESCLVFNSDGIVPKHMTEIIFAQLVVTLDGTEYKSNMSRFSIAEYCYKRLYKDTNSTNDQKALYNHVLGYGTYAQKVLNYNVDNTPADYFYVNAENSIVDSVEIAGNTYNYSAGIFKADTNITLKYNGALQPAEFAEWSIVYTDAQGETSSAVLDDNAEIKVTDKHIIATSSVDLIAVDFDDSTTGGISNVTTDESKIGFNIVDSPAASYTGDKALQATKTASKTSSVATTTIPLMNDASGNSYILSFDLYTTGSPNSAAFAQLNTRSKGADIFKTTFSYSNNDGSYGAFFTMFSNGNGDAGNQYLYSGNTNTTGEWVNIRFEYYLLDGGIWTARFYLDDVFISDNTLAKNSTTALDEVTIGHHDYGYTVYFDNISFVRCDKAYTETPETAAPDFEGTRGTGTYFNSATSSDFVLDHEIDFDKNNNGRTQIQAGPCLTSGNNVADSYNANGFAYLYRTEGGSTHAGTHNVTVANTAGYDKTIVEFDIAISKPETSWPVTVIIANGVRKADFYIGYNAATGKLFARDNKVEFDVDTWNNIRLEIDNNALNSATGTVKAEIYINGVHAGTTTLYDIAARAKNYISISLRKDNSELVVCYDNLFVGYRSSAE